MLEKVVTVRKQLEQAKDLQLSRGESFLDSRIAAAILVAGKEQPGEGHMIEFAQVVEFIIHCQALLAHPVEGFG